MVLTGAIILLILWTLGIVGAYSMTWYANILLVASLIMFGIIVIRGK